MLLFNERCGVKFQLMLIIILLELMHVGLYVFQNFDNFGSRFVSTIKDLAFRELTTLKVETHQEQSELVVDRLALPRLRHLTAN